MAKKILTLSRELDVAHARLSDGYVYPLVSEYARTQHAVTLELVRSIVADLLDALFQGGY